LSDFQISPDGNTIYIADFSFKGNRPALIVYDVKTDTARRVLDNSTFVRGDPFSPRINGKVLFEDMTANMHVDSIGLDKQGEWLYFAPMAKSHLYRIKTSALRDISLTPHQLNAQIETYSKKPMSDGIALDAAGNVYVTDIEHSSIVVINTNREVRTLIRDKKRLRWPDGLDFDSEGYLYVTCSNLHSVLQGTHKEEGPFHIFKFKPDLINGSQNTAQ